MYQPASIRTGPADWRAQGACQQEDPELFFPVTGTGPALVQLDQARAICRRCPVRAQCLSFALETAQDHGVWGGTSEDERRALRRNRRRRQGTTGAAREWAHRDARSDRGAVIRHRGP
jgi:WhiB family transcriptional regulator, redox-sensing transcriptional regulator